MMQISNNQSAIETFDLKECIFHFNKHHLVDPSVPMWCLKFKGITRYVQHVECNVPWSTKETPDNPSTKGSIKIKKCRLTIDDQNVATLTSIPGGPNDHH